MEHHLLALRETILAAAAEDRPWADVCTPLRNLVAARTISLWVGDPAAGRIEIIGTSFGPDVEQQYTAYYHQHDLWTLRAMAQAQGKPILGTDLVREQELRESEVYRDFYRSIGLFHLAAMSQPLGHGPDLVNLGLHRPETDQPFDQKATAALHQGMVSLTRGLRMRQRLTEATGAANVALAGFEALGKAALVADRTGRILHANAAARLLLGSQRGLASRHGRCLASHPADAEALDALILQAAAGGLGGQLRLRPGAQGAALTVLAKRPRDTSAGVVLLLLDPDARRTGAKTALLRDLYGLTLAEAEVAEAAALGLAAQRIAAQRGSAEATVRTQLRAAMEKTGQPNLRALAALVAGLPG